MLRTALFESRSDPGQFFLFIARQFEKAAQKASVSAQFVGVLQVFGSLSLVGCALGQDRMPDRLPGKADPSFSSARSHALQSLLDLTSLLRASCLADEGGIGSRQQA